MLFYYSAPLHKDCIVTSRCMQFTFGDKKEGHLLNESVLPITEKERRRLGKRNIGPRIKYGHANLIVSKLLLLVCMLNARIIKPFTTTTITSICLRLQVFSTRFLSRA